MSKVATIGLDLAKHVFDAVCCDARGKAVRKKVLRSRQVREFFVHLEPALIGLESRASAHYWAQELGGLSHTVKLIPPQYLEGFVRGNKNDYKVRTATLVDPRIRPPKS